MRGPTALPLPAAGTPQVTEASQRGSLCQEAQASLPLPSVSAPKKLGVDTFQGKQIIFNHDLLLVNHVCLL